MKYINKNIIAFFSLFFIISCNKYDEKIPFEQNNEIMATLNEQNIYVNEIDSLISFQIYKLRLETLDMLASKKIIKNEAKKQNITLDKLIENQINKKCKTVTNEDFEKYISRSGISHIDTNNILTYLLTIHKRDREGQYVDSLKQNYSLKIKLQPPFYRKINTSDLYFHHLTKNKSTTKVYIISDFKCPGCQHAEKILQSLYKKYNNTVNFMFISFNDYIDKDALACEAAAKQNKFRQMHDIIFNNSVSLHKDSIYYDFAKKIGLDIEQFHKDMKNNQILKTLLNPTFRTLMLSYLTICIFEFSPNIKNRSLKALFSLLM